VYYSIDYHHCQDMFKYIYIYMFLAIKERQGTYVLDTEMTGITDKSIDNESHFLTSEEKESPSSLERHVRFAPDDQLVQIRYFTVEKDAEDDLHPHRDIHASRDLDREEGRMAWKQVHEQMSETIPWRKPVGKYTTTL
jgi:hypothetical protein